MSLFRNRRLSRLLVDRAALQGTMKKARDLGMPLLFVNRIGDISLVQGGEKRMTALYDRVSISGSIDQRILSILNGIFPC